ncbi:MAG: ribosome maturation factor RimP [Elusimicrobia bacterium]|nr:ribosome maturation factor RimP [Elusimicrobiota bacterium]
MGFSVPVDLKVIEEKVGPLLAEELAELVDLQCIHQGGRWVLRFFLDKAGGITLGDCERLSRKIESLMDSQNLLQVSYVLEVSSPGVDRILKKERDFERFRDHRVHLKLKEPSQGQKNYRGTLKGLEAGRIAIQSDLCTQEFSLEDVQEVRLDPEVQP